MSKLNELPEELSPLDEDIFLVRDISLSIDKKVTKENLLKQVTDELDNVGVTITEIQDNLSDLSKVNSVALNGELNTTQLNILEDTSAYTLPPLENVPDNMAVYILVPENAKDESQSISSVNGDVIISSDTTDTVLLFDEGVWGSIVVYKHSSTEWRI